MRPLLALSLILLPSALNTSLAAQATSERLAEAEERIRAIYERGALNARPFRGQWRQGGEEYILRKHTPSGERVEVMVDTASGRETGPVPETKPSPAGNFAPGGKFSVVNRGGTLFLRSTETEEQVRLGRAAVPTAVRSGRVSWSPDGSWLAFVETDHSEVRMRSRLVPGDSSYPGVTEDRFARVGGEIAKQRIGVVATEVGETIWLDIDTPEDGLYLGMVEWTPDANELLIEKLSRFRNEREFLLANPNTGTTARIFHEADPAWVVASYGKNSGLTWLDGGASFLVLSEREGWRQAYVHARSGERLAKLTPGEYDIIERAHVDHDNGLFYFYASPENSTQKYLYRVPLNGSREPMRVTPRGQPGTHAYDFSPNGKWAFHTHSTFDSPPVTSLISLPDHRKLRVLDERAALRERVDAILSQPTDFFSLDLGDGVEVDGWMIKPHGFDPSKKYPLLVYVYGEPHAQTVLDAWAQAQAHYHRVLADQGYLVVSIDNRGTPAPKGAAWRRACFGSLGPLSTEEQAQAVQELIRTRSYVDRSRVGIWGWSGGGSNTLNAMFRKPEVYHVGIAVAAKPQPWLYNAWFQEIYMETRETNPEGYQQSAPIHFAEGLQGDLLIIHGTGELNTHVQIIEGLVDRLIELGKRFDYMSYPHRRHGIREGAGTTVHLRMHMIRYWLDHLAPGPR